MKLNPLQFRGAWAALLGLALLPISAQASDGRDVANGLAIPDESYCDQPYVVVRPDGGWVCLLTTSSSHEGAHGQHIVATISRDQGRSWSKLNDIEPANGPEASWVVPLITPGGRIYAIYTYNTTGITNRRADTMGTMMFKFSDDGGQTWSRQRYPLPMPVTKADRSNDFAGKIQMFWGIDKPNIVDGSVYFAFTKLGRYMLDFGEGWLYRSDNVLTELNPDKIHWQFLPDGDEGLRAPGLGKIQEEHNLVPLNKDNLYIMYRTETGHPAHTYSRNGGHSWSTPAPAAYTPGGRVFKTPRACPMVWRTENGKYLFWFHNHSAKSFRGRNPVWISGGLEKGGYIYWSQPEILLYCKEDAKGMSYPDLIEQDGKYWFSETQKTVARVHAIDPTLLEGMWRQGERKALTTAGLALSVDPASPAASAARLPQLPDLARGQGISLDFRLQVNRWSPVQVIAEALNPKGDGLRLQTTPRKSVELEFTHAGKTVRWDCDPGAVTPGRPHHLTVIVDGGPCVISWVVDGLLCDGGDARDQGWYRFDSSRGAAEKNEKFLLTGLAADGRIQLDDGPTFQLAPPANTNTLLLRLNQTATVNVPNRRLARLAVLHTAVGFNLNGTNSNATNGKLTVAYTDGSTEDLSWDVADNAGYNSQGDSKVALAHLTLVNPPTNARWPDRVWWCQRFALNPAKTVAALTFSTKGVRDGSGDDAEFGVFALSGQTENQAAWQPLPLPADQLNAKALALNPSDTLGRGFRSQQAAEHSLEVVAGAVQAASGATLRLAPSIEGKLLNFRVYNRYLRTSEAIANFHSAQ
jgi:hypothetical protein